MNAKYARSGTRRANLRRLLLLTFAICTSSLALADRLHFDDGESITGTLVSVSDGKVQWSSVILGELSIDQSHVKYIETGDFFDLKTTSNELRKCWMYIQSRRQHLHCENGVQTISNWQLVVAAGEPIEEEPARLTQQGNMTIALEDSAGNTNITKYNVDARSEWRYLDIRHTFTFLYQEESADSATTRNRWRGAYQYDQFFSDQWFVTGNAFYDEDEFKNIERRYSGGVGMGYQFLDTSFFDLSGKGTVNYVDELLTDGTDRSTPAFLWNLDFVWRLNNTGTEFFHRHVLLQAFNRTEDWEVDTLTGLRYPINGSFSSVVQLEWDFDNLPAEDGVEKEDRKWSIGINYDW